MGDWGSSLGWDGHSKVLGPSRGAQLGVCTGEPLEPSPVRARKFGGGDGQGQEAQGLSSLQAQESESKWRARSLAPCLARSRSHWELRQDRQAPCSPQLVIATAWNEGTGWVVACMDPCAQLSNRSLSQYNVAAARQLRPFPPPPCHPGHLGESFHSSN